MDNGMGFDERIVARLPEAAAGYVGGLLAGRSITVRVSRPRRTKLGDHHPPRRGDRSHRITVNEDLNPFAFLTTLLHEIAHADVWDQTRTRWRRPRPHGREWKRAFAGLLEPVVGQEWLPEDVATALASYMENPAAMSCSDRGLVLALARYDAHAVARTRVEDLAAGQWFRVDSGQVFCLGRRVRTRFLCVEPATGAEYRVHGLAFADPVDAAACIPITAARTKRECFADGRSFRRRARGGRAAGRSAYSGSARGPHQT